MKFAANSARRKRGDTDGTKRYFIGRAVATREREIAAVELNGFLGIGGSRIELPLSKLSRSGDGNVQTSMTDEELESIPEVGEEM